MDQIGHVIKVEQGVAEVDVRRVSACGDKCGSCSGTCNIPAVKVKLEDQIGLEVGDYVEIGVRTELIMKSAFMVYMIPLGILIGSIVFGVKIFKSEMIGVLLGAASLVLSHLLLKKIDKKMVENEEIKLEIVKKI